MGVIENPFYGTEPKATVENVDIYERLTRIENPEDIKEIVGIVC